MKITFVGLVATVGLCLSTTALGSSCLIPNRDLAFEHADQVFTAKLISASIAQDFSVTGEMVLENALKGNPQASLSFTATVDPLLGCGPDLVIGKFYLVFLKQGQTTISGVTGTRLLDGRDGQIEWVVLKMQERNAT